MAPDLYTSLVDRWLWPLWEERLRERPTPALLAALRQSERASLDELRSMQTASLRQLLIHAERSVPHYQREIREVGIDPQTASLEDLRSLPLLTRQRARASVDERVSLHSPKPSIRKTTGGTTGEPLVIRYDAGSESWRQAIKLRGFGWAGYRVGARAAHYWGAPSTTRGLAHRAKAALDHALRREIWLDCNQQDEASRRGAARALARHRPAFLFAYAQAAAGLARAINRGGWRDWSDIRVVCGAEPVTAADRIELEKAFGEVFETYGCREVMLIGTECAAHDGLHLSMENLVVEVLAADGSPTPPGQVGRVVLTDLHNFGCPLIRYANGDLAIARPEDESCACGRAHARLTSVEGRSTETLRDAAGEAVGGMVFNLIFSPLAEHVDQFQVHQHADASLTIRVVPVGDTLAPGVRVHLEAGAARYLPGLPLRIEIVEAIALSASGKKRIVIVDPAPDAGSDA